MCLTYFATLQARLAHGGSIMPSDLSLFRDLATLSSRNALSAAALSPYPPVFFLLIAPLRYLPPIGSYIYWLGLSTALFTWAASSLRMPWQAIALSLLSAPNLFCMMMGQTGTIISSLLLLGLGLAETSPVLAGIAAGCLIIKPQFALLLPVCFLASHNKTAFITAAATVILLCLLTAILFGATVWSDYFFHKAANNLVFLDRRWPQLYQYSMVTMFMTLRSLGVSLLASNLIQTMLSIGAALVCWHMWRQTRIDRLVRLIITLCLVVLATPYAYLYDIAAIAAVLCAYATRPTVTAWLPLAFFWVCTCFYGFLSTWFFLTGGIILVLIVLFLLPKISPPDLAA